MLLLFEQIRLNFEPLTSDRGYQDSLYPGILVSLRGGSTDEAIWFSGIASLRSQ